MKEEDLTKILQRPGYRVADARGHPFTAGCGCAACQRDKAEATKSGGVHELKRQVAESKLEIRFAQQLADRGARQWRPDSGMLWDGAAFQHEMHLLYARNYLDAIPGRNFELDFAWVPRRFFVEVDGGAHRTKGRFKADTIKHAMLLLAGWRGFRVSGADVREGRAIEWTMEWLSRQ